MQIFGFKTLTIKHIIYISNVEQEISNPITKKMLLQDFSKKPDIDLSLSIPEIDQQLYKKYKLSEEEIAFVESMIEPMAE